MLDGEDPTNASSISGAGSSTGWSTGKDSAVRSIAGITAQNAIYFIRTCIRIYTEPAQDAPWKLVKAQPIAAYDIPMIVLITANLVLGLLSTTIINLIQQGLSMFG